MDGAMQIFEMSKNFPREEMFSLTDQVRRSTRSICTNIAEAWRKRRYKAAFISKLSDADAEAGETQVWIEFTVKCQYVSKEWANTMFTQYDHIQGKLVRMMDDPDSWLLK